MHLLSHLQNARGLLSHELVLASAWQSIMPCAPCNSFRLPQAVACCEGRIAQLWQHHMKLENALHNCTAVNMIDWCITPHKLQTKHGSERSRPCLWQPATSSRYEFKSKALSLLSADSALGFDVDMSIPVTCTSEAGRRCLSCLCCSGRSGLAHMSNMFNATGTSSARSRLDCKQRMTKSYARLLNLPGDGLTTPHPRIQHKHMSNGFYLMSSAMAPFHLPFLNPDLTARWEADVRTRLQYKLVLGVRHVVLVELS